MNSINVFNDGARIAIHERQGVGRRHGVPVDEDLRCQRHGVANNFKAGAAFFLVEDANPGLELIAVKSRRQPVVSLPETGSRGRR